MRGTLCAMAKLYRVPTPNIAAVEFPPTFATLPATNFFVYQPSSTFHAIEGCKFQCSANHISHSNLTADPNVARHSFHVIQVKFTTQTRKQ